MIFDGPAFAKEIESRVTDKGRTLANKLKVVSIVVGDDPASLLYTRLKEQAAHRVGIDFEVQRISNIEYRELQAKIRTIGEREDVTGVMVQLPIKDLQGSTLQEVLSAIPLNKDVDGLRWEESGVQPATVRAVLSICEEIARRKSSDHLPKIAQGSELWEQKFVVLGARGAVGRPLVYFLRQRGVEVSEVEWDTPNPAELIQQGEVVISCVGKAGLVTGEMVGEGVVAIDVGMSMVNGVVVGDMTAEVYQKASVAVPVPKGVGPVTIASLMANTIDLVI